MYVCMYTIRAKKFEAFKGDATNENVANVANEKKGHEAKYEPSEWEIIFTKYIIALLGSLEMLNSVKVLRLLHILP